MQQPTRGAPQQQEQLLVRFQNATRVWNRPAPLPQSGRGPCDDVDDDNDGDDEVGEILAFVSKLTGWPMAWLRVASLVRPFCDVRASSSIRGGKGGFGTLLKGQSRQAANQTTLDFGSCRDLQGRRLRSVNDEIAQRLHREWQRKVDAGQATRQEMVQALSDTGSGIAGWFLQLPAWAEKGTRKVARRQHHQQYQAWKRAEQDRLRAKERQRQAEERVVDRYVQSTQHSVEAVTSHLQQAVQQGLLASQEGHQQSRKRKATAEGATGAEAPGTSVAPTSNLDGKGDVAKAVDLVVESLKESEVDADPTSDFVTLSGEVVQVPPGEHDDSRSSSCLRLQGASNFATIGVLLRDLENAEAPSWPCQSESLYYEVVVHSGGLVQVGWVADPDRLDSEAGDGAGDVPGSWSYDGSRRIKMRTAHELLSPPQPLSASLDPNPGAVEGGSNPSSPGPATTSSEYGVQWKAGDVIGCLWDFAHGSLRYFVNGEDLGVAFEDVRGAAATPRLLVPAVSINPGEVVELRLHRQDFQHVPGANFNAAPVGALLLDQVLSSPSEADAAAPVSECTEKEVPIARTSSADPETKPAAATNPAEPNDVGSDSSTAPSSPLDLNEFDSVDALALVGMDRLKAALQTRGLKCGGTALERATRLFAVKGLAPDRYPTKLLAKK